jgi:hypothetical protein
MAREAAEGGRVSLWVRELVAGVKSPPGGDSRPLRRHDGEREGGFARRHALERSLRSQPSCSTCRRCRTAGQHKTWEGRGAIGGAPLQFRAAWSTGIQTVSKYFKIKLIQKGFCIAQKIRKKIQF